MLLLLIFHQSGWKHFLAPGWKGSTFHINVQRGRMTLVWPGSKTIWWVGALWQEFLGGSQAYQVGVSVYPGSCGWTVVWIGAGQRLTCKLGSGGSSLKNYTNPARDQGRLPVQRSYEANLGHVDPWSYDGPVLWGMKLLGSLLFHHSPGMTEVIRDKLKGLEELESEGLEGWWRQGRGSRERHSQNKPANKSLSTYTLSHSVWASVSTGSCPMIHTWKWLGMSSFVSYIPIFSRL